MKNQHISQTLYPEQAAPNGCRASLCLSLLLLGIGLIAFKVLALDEIPSNPKTGGWNGIVNHHLWWMKHLPHNPGITNGFYNNWWQYIVNYDKAIQKLPPPGASFQKAKNAMYAD